MASDFQRARSEEQREARRETILSTTAELLADTRVADLSLNELARRAGLAKSNVLRYFESREAILLQLFDREYQAWLDDLEVALADATDLESVAAIAARTAAARPLLCELCASAPGVLERNVSGEVAVAYKRAALAAAVRLSDILTRSLGTWTPGARLALAAAVNLGIGGTWASTQPSPGMASAYAAHPEFAVFRHAFEPSLREYLATVLTGLIHREPELDLAADAFERAGDPAPEPATPRGLR